MLFSSRQIPPHLYYGHFSWVGKGLGRELFWAHWVSPNPVSLLKGFDCSIIERCRCDVLQKPKSIFCVEFARIGLSAYHQLIERIDLIDVDVRQPPLPINAADVREFAAGVQATAQPNTILGSDECGGESPMD